MLKLKEKERNSIINALRAGVVPPVGLRHMQVGRAQEIAQIVKDLDHIQSGASTMKFIVGDFGTGKSFFLTLCKLMAHEKKLVVMNADITTERILCASDGRARSLMSELVKNMSCRSRPEGNALKVVIETWIEKFTTDCPIPTSADFHKAITPISHLSLSNDFAKILFTYFTAYQSQDNARIEQCMKWLRAEYATKTEARSELGVTAIIEDDDIYNMIKLFAGFCRMAGFAGMLVNIDEIAVLIRQRGPLRNKNYETLLTIINDCLQGSVEGLGFLFGATTEAIENKEKGLHSYGALETRLASNSFVSSTVRDLSGPVMHLQTLTKEETFVLIHKLQQIFCSHEEGKEVIDEDGMKAFFMQAYSTMGSAEFLNPRDLIKNFLDLLSVIENNPGKSWKDFITAGPTNGPEGEKKTLVKLKVS